ncbi:TPM domain-containing protein [Streptomyces sp. 35G-GA-8]|uniref:TPM domain-containing protein n=1 Tax=Streptomyces sp. 35G-GA-8 TaxID=2939434 RepID=UPI00201FA4B8|nr:TPM domain-containing protein [Streptomyces sp. 35G-GA-8]MCL7375929.1 TPM domain-containing protein [Streptomyces sp. 35G-GA-8]
MAWWLVVPTAQRAAAEQPIPLDRQGQITDKVGALGGQRTAVSRALDRLYKDQRVQLFVVYVRDFSGHAPQSWADTTATRNGLGRDDLLLAVATHDRQYAYSADIDSPLTNDQLGTVARTAVEPALRQNDWSAAAIGAADGFNAVLAGRPVPTPAITPGVADPGGPAADGGAATNLVLPVIVVLGAALIGAYSFAKRKRRMAARTTPRGGRQGWGSPGGTEEPAPTPLPELDSRAKQVLVETDDALRTSQEELGFATAQFGEEAAAPFTDAVAFAKGQLTLAFRLRQQLDDAFPEDDPTRRRMLDEIIARCAEANDRLDAESEGFDRLRALERNAPQAVESVGATFRELNGRVATARSTLATMRERYADSASAPVADSVAQAEDRLVFASTALDEARALTGAGDNGKAAVHVRAAEAAVGQTATLVETVERRAQELSEAAGKLAGALTEMETDLADARGLLKGTTQGTSTADLQGRISRAEAVVSGVRRELDSGRYDPIDALRRVEEADAVLDEALTGAREREAGSRRAGTLLDQAMLTARSAIGAAADYIGTHRGAVGSQARTRLMEAQRRLELAHAASVSGDAQGALAEAQQADALARTAQDLAEQDVRSFGSGYGGGGVQGTGGGLGGAVLGGILLGGLFGGGIGRGGGFGGGYRGGGYRGGGGPGSFGGGGTRGRMGGGGRF